VHHAAELDVPLEHADSLATFDPTGSDSLLVPTSLLGSAAAGSSVVASPIVLPAPSRPNTQLQQGIHKPKVYMMTRSGMDFLQYLVSLIVIKKHCVILDGNLLWILSMVLL
jgi:hypothetical protein